MPHLTQSPNVVRNKLDMLKKLTGYLFAVIGFVGFGFFRTYKSSVIPFSTLWFVVSIFIGLVGLYFVYISQSKKLSKQEKYNKECFDRLKQNGEKIVLTVDNCEIRENNYYEEVTDQRHYKMQAIDALYNPNENYKQNYIEQTAIIYNYINGDKKIRMTSQSFPFAIDTLTSYIENELLFLYVNRFDKNEYAFEIIV